MGFPVIAIKTIAELAFTAIPLVERLIRGKNRGKEKKEAVREFILEELQNVAGVNPESLPDFANFDWVAAIKDYSTIVALVDDVIDASVALLNGLAKYNRTQSGPVAASPIQLA
ncbi:MAG: hypothetical protein V3T23_11255 [Nitrososphaerales archaeon]